MRPIKMSPFDQECSMLYMARTNLPTYLFSDSQLHEISYIIIQYCDASLRRVQTLFLDFEASLAKEVGNFFTVFFQ